MLAHPLACSWWRVVLDEAQMVGTGLSSVAVMAGRLHSSHRWAVTGTPIGPGGLDDIQGLLKVLHHDPFCDPLKWKWCVANPYLTGDCTQPCVLSRRTPACISVWKLLTLPMQAFAGHDISGCSCGTVCSSCQLL